MLFFCSCALLKQHFREFQSRVIGKGNFFSSGLTLLLACPCKGEINRLSRHCTVQWMIWIISILICQCYLLQHALGQWKFFTPCIIPEYRSRSVIAVSNHSIPVMHSRFIINPLPHYHCHQFLPLFAPFCCWRRAMKRKHDYSQLRNSTRLNGRNKCRNTLKKYVELQICKTSTR